MEEQVISLPPNQFKLFKKWFWIGVVIGFLHPIAGLIYGIALLFEKNHRQEGLVIIIWTIIAFLLSYYLIGPWVVKTGLLPKFQMVR